MTVYRFACGHVGRTNEAPRARAQVFIRVAEIREPAEDRAQNCPECK